VTTFVATAVLPGMRSPSILPSGVMQSSGGSGEKDTR
jgi:hypothetical protein